MWQWNPVGSVEEKRRFEKDATDLVISNEACVSSLPVPNDPLSHLLFTPCPVLLTKGFPNNAGGQDRGVAKEAAPNDEIVRTVEFEEKRFSRLESTELDITARLPKIDFVQLRDM